MPRNKRQKMNNPYPGPIEVNGIEFEDPKHIAWQEGWDAREVVTKELYEACKGIEDLYVANKGSDTEFIVMRTATLDDWVKVKQAIAHHEEGK